MKACQSATKSGAIEKENEMEWRSKGCDCRNGVRKREGTSETERSRRVLAGLKGGCEEREFPLSYIFFLVFSSVPWEKFVV